MLKACLRGPVTFRLSAAMAWLRWALLSAGQQQGNSASSWLPGWGRRTTGDKVSSWPNVMPPRSSLLSLHAAAGCALLYMLRRAVWWCHHFQCGVLACPQDAANQAPLLPIPVATQRRPDPRLALTISVAGWIAKSSDFGDCLPVLWAPWHQWCV